MAPWVPYVIQLGEAVIVALITAFGSHAAGADWNTAMGLGIGAGGLKGLPSQLLGKRPD